MEGSAMLTMVASIELAPDWIDYFARGLSIPRGAPDVEV
jgi:hypothetical protein